MTIDLIKNSKSFNISKVVLKMSETQLPTDDVLEVLPPNKERKSSKKGNQKVVNNENYCRLCLYDTKLDNDFDSPRLGCQNK